MQVSKLNALAAQAFNLGSLSWVPSLKHLKSVLVYIHRRLGMDEAQDWLATMNQLISSTHASNVQVEVTVEPC